MSNCGMKEISNMDSSPWKRPDEVMRLHRLKLKKKALQARITRPDHGQISNNVHPGQDSSLLDDISQSEKRKNPFKCENAKRFKCDSDLSTASEGSLFQLLSEKKCEPRNESLNESSFQSFLADHNTSDTILQQQQLKIPVDWSLKTKIRLLSPKQFPWSQKLRTCEEASGITGYVRCMNTGEPDEESNGRSLDTSPNARFHQCTLYWQHPSLPWLPLFPRTRSESTKSTLPPFAMDSAIKDCLHQEWCESFRSLFQLVRARQCPFFYLCANTFTCLFRAAGIAGVPEMHAILSPTTRGLRAALKEEDVVFSMPLKKEVKGRTSDEGYETLECTHEEGPATTGSDNEIEAKDEDEETSEWLESMGVTEAEIKRLESEQAKIVGDRERGIDHKPESLVYVEGVEAQALFNFLMDCRSCVAPTGALAGIPPTLLSPVAFKGAALGALKVRHSVVRVEGESFHSVEMRGPILPHSVHSLASLLSASNPTFSTTFANVNSTKAFSVASPKVPNTAAALSSSTASVFEKESLSDSGLVSGALEAFCCPSNSFTLDNLKFSDSVYSWTCS